MTISYNWLCDYLPEKIEPEKLGRILTSIGLEVESLEYYESIKGGLKGLVIGEVMECEKHPGADKLKITKVNIGKDEPLRIVCGASNVAVGQKVVVATVGSTIYPLRGEPLTMKVAKIRGEESNGMICAEDEIGLSSRHDGIMVLPADVRVGSYAADYFKPYTDWIYEIGLTPNRMDAMSHLGVARDVCAYLIHHDKKKLQVKLPFSNGFKADNNELPISVTIENKTACQRYAGVSLKGVTVKESPQWLQNRLKAIGLRPINNIVDITNYILHETGQPLHAFDAAKISGAKVIVKNLAEGSSFVTLDEKERKLSAEDLMICNAEEGMCIAGVFGGIKSGVTESTTDIFLESAWFNPTDIRKTSFRHGLRTDAATRFEKGVDISNTVNVLKRAALMIKEIAGGSIASEVIDVYPSPKAKTEVSIKYHYLKKLSGKIYHPDTVKKILEALGFTVIKDSIDELGLSVPYHKTDISVPADIVEEIMRIDGLDNVIIPETILLSPQKEYEDITRSHLYKEKLGNYLTGLGFNEIFTNSITSKAYYKEEELKHAVTMINNLSAEHDVLRLSMLETGLQSIAYNLNRKNSDLRFFEFGNTYSSSAKGEYKETAQLGIYVTGSKNETDWKNKATKSDIFYLKGVVNRLLQQMGVSGIEYTEGNNSKLHSCLQGKWNNEVVLEAGMVNQNILQQFDIKQPVHYACLQWNVLLKIAAQHKIEYKPIPKFPMVQRDLALVLDKSVSYDKVEQVARTSKLNKLQSVSLFDVFEGDKLGAGKKSLAVSFTFLDEEKTMTDDEIEKMMNKLMRNFETQLGAEIRK
jgi:phenylalanyl-tRNA synthetase beta chain